MIEKKIEKNNVTIALNVFYAKKNPAYVAKHNSNCVRQVNLLMIPNGQKWHLAVKRLSALFRGIKSKHYGNFCCLNCLYSLITENKLESYKRVCENKDFCNVIMSSEKTKILDFNQYQKSDKAPFIFYAYLECIIKKIDGYKNNPESSSTTKLSKHILSGISFFQCPQYYNLEALKISMKYTEVKIVWKSFVNS